MFFTICQYGILLFGVKARSIKKAPGRVPPETVVQFHSLTVDGPIMLICSYFVMAGLDPRLSGRAKWVVAKRITTIKDRPRAPVPGLEPGIHAFLANAPASQDVDGRDKPGQGAVSATNCVQIPQRTGLFI
jgi:hypothetical protein